MKTTNDDLTKTLIEALGTALITILVAVLSSKTQKK